jgi:hypothetical protein
MLLILLLLLSLLLLLLRCLAGTRLSSGHRSIRLR